MLPYKYYESKIFFDASAIGSGINSWIPLASQYWEYVNTDAMKFEVVKKRRITQNNLPVLNNFAYHLKENNDNFIKGFKSMFKALLTHKEELSSKTIPLKDFKNLKIRFVFRPTRQYRDIIFKVLEPKYLKDEKTFQNELLKELEKNIKIENPRFFNKLFSEESRALSQLDIPLFSMNSNQAHYYNENIFYQSGYKKMMNTLKNLNTKLMSDQIELIKKSFLS